jgi:hypothetical protein
VTRHSALLAVFLLSGLSTWAGIAGASAAPESPSTVESIVIAPASVADLLEQPSSIVELDWGARIDC